MTSFVFEGKTYLATVKDLLDTSCAGCAFYANEEGCNASPDDCFEMDGLPDGKTIVWVEVK